MKTKKKTTRTRKDSMSRLRRENIASRKRVMRAEALGQESKEFCLAKVIGDVVFQPLDFSRVQAPNEYQR
jgi:hypothetical protein